MMRITSDNGIIYIHGDLHRYMRGHGAANDIIYKTALVITFSGPRTILKNTRAFPIIDLH